MYEGGKTETFAREMKAYQLNFDYRRGQMIKIWQNNNKMRWPQLYQSTTHSGVAPWSPKKQPEHWSFEKELAQESQPPQN